MALESIKNRSSSAMSARSAMSWSAIFSGAFMTLGCGFFLITLGNAIGLSTANALGIDRAATFWSWIYFAASMIVSYGVGAFVCTRSSSVETTSSGMLHGLIAWALASTIALTVGMIATFGMHSLLTGVALNSTNWLAVLVLGGGAVVASSVGQIGKRSLYGTVTSEQQDEAVVRRVS